jgi:hypothetical protein
VDFTPAAKDRRVTDGAARQFVLDARADLAPGGARGCAAASVRVCARGSRARATGDETCEHDKSENDTHALIEASHGPKVKALVSPRNVSTRVRGGSV